MRMTGDEVAMAAKRTFSNLSIFVGAAVLAAAVAIAPADAKKSKNTEVEDAIPDADANQPMTLVVSLNKQRVDIYRGMTLISSSPVSTGKRGHATKAGVFSILEKQRHHYSNLYGGAPMPWMNRITWSGTALHAGVVPGYPASHGCIRLPYSFAPRLFKITTVGEHVIVAHDRVAPKLIEHPALFQPLPPPMPPILVKQETPPQVMHRSSNETAPAFGSHLPVVLAKADAAAPDAHPAAEAPAPITLHAAVEETPAPIERPASIAMLQDTRVHAIDPSAGPSAGSRVHAFTKPSDRAAQNGPVAETADKFAKDQDRLASPAGATDTPSSPVISESVASPSAPGSANTVVAMKVPEPKQTAEPQAGPILSVSASALAQPLPVPASAVITMMSLVHPPMPLAKPSVITAKLVAGTAAAAVEAAEPRSTEPLRILVTRRTQRDRMTDVQYILASMGYLDAQNFDGTFGRQTAGAIKAFQKAQDLPETGAFTDDVVKKIYEVAGKEEPPTGRLFLRQKFASVFDTAVGFRNPDEPLGTQVFTVMNFAPGDTKAQWMAIGMRDSDDPTAVLDRLVIPDDLRQNISERLTPGSSLIIADTAINSATLPRGADFLVWDTSKSSKVQQANASGDDVAPQPRKKRRVTTQRRSTPAYTRSYQRNPWPF